MKKIGANILAGYKKLAYRLQVAWVVGGTLVLFIVMGLLFSGSSHEKPFVRATSPHPIFAKKPSAFGAINVSPAIAKGAHADLSDVKAKLAHIENLLSRHNPVINIDAVRSGMRTVTQEITQIDTHNKTRYSALQSHITNLSSQLVQYQKNTLQKLDVLAAMGRKSHCLRSTLLPFSVQSIDIINGRNVVSVLYADRISPLEKDFILAGWKLAASDYAHQSARFVNQKGACVRITVVDPFIKEGPVHAS